MNPRPSCTTVFPRTDASTSSCGSGRSHREPYVAPATDDPEIIELGDDDIEIEGPPRRRLPSEEVTMV